MGSEKEFLFFIEPKEFIDRVDFEGRSSSIKNVVRNSNGVVAPVDINKRMADASSSIKLGAMASEDLDGLLRSIPNKRGERVYKNSILSAGHLSQNSLLNYQTFVHVGSLLNLSGLSSLFEHFNFSGISNSAACTISYKNKGETYVAFYVPPIVETVTKESVRIPLENLRKRAEKEDSIKLPAHNGDGTVSLTGIIKGWDSILKNSAVNSVQIVRDGTHRLFLAHIVGAPQYVISMNGFAADLPSVPIPTNTIVKTSTKPEKLEDRYLGLHVEGWTDEKFVGIDG